MATITENPSAILGEAVLGRMELGATPYREPGHIAIGNQREARIRMANMVQADIAIANQRQARITIESE